MTIHLVALSGGKDSTALALRLREINPEVPYVYLCTPTGDELPDMVEHWALLERRLGTPLVRIQRQGGLRALIEGYGSLPNNRQRWCTRQLKIQPCLAWNYPDIYEDAARQERATGHTFRSPSRDTWPASLDALRQRFEAGDIPRGTLKMLEEPEACRVCRL